MAFWLMLCLLITTNTNAQWSGLARNVDGSYLKNFSSSDFINNSSLNIAPSKVDISFYYTQFTYTNTINLPEKFSIEIRTLNTSISAYDTYLGMKANGKTNYIRFMGDSWALQYTSIGIEDQIVTQDKSYLLKDLSKYRTIKIEFDNTSRKASFYFDDQLLSIYSFTERICQLSAIYIQYKGSGSCDWLKIVDETNNTLLFENFDSPLNFASPKPLPDLCTNNTTTNLFIPDAFTPNGDKINDELIIPNLEKSTDSEVWIYSRWGEVVFHSKGYTSPWDGTFKGTPVLSGNYVLVIHYNGFKYRRALAVIQ